MAEDIEHDPSEYYNYKAKYSHVFEKNVWKVKGGEEISIFSMTFEHLTNTINFLRKIDEHEASIVASKLEMVRFIKYKE